MFLYSIKGNKSSCKVPVVLARFEFSREIFEKNPMSRLVKIRPVGDELPHEDGVTDGQTDRQTDTRT